ncbi:acetolactate synthase small subunit [Shouchella clausii]|uniref:Acetolactate synthase small subunit n=1 Tax=Shouchella rhizosphaerae TaxID=866786 RepID=A0ABZ2CXJ5_9BACI|nr:MULTISPECIES: acetolactate synthase small subunit [Shouchella]MCM3313374.1 acetolactate synthase small subunit [Psychrobacillus sp. MER TA 17]ALA54437.1 Acetolactate synthase small subunit [Shouchella clausii]KKI87730.1 acetolactate synthase [Shouchella clausii]MBU3232453.1 acetolactate synthase small subunit [Shouchella clausii]MBU3265831.1 acetolactate synthase small subunit [Shouchella clausii]
MKRTITVLVNNKSGVLNRMTGLFARRQYNIDSITVGVTENPTISRMTFVVFVDSMENVEQMIKQLHKQVDVLKIKDITDEAIVERELALVRVGATPQQRGEIASLAETFRAQAVDIGKESMTLQITGNNEKIEAFIELVKPYGIQELARTGVTAVNRSSKASTDTSRLTLIN